MLECCSLSLLQGIFPTQGSNPGLPHGGQILYHLSPQGCVTSGNSLTILIRRTGLLLGSHWHPYLGPGGRVLWDGSLAAGTHRSSDTLPRPRPCCLPPGVRLEGRRESVEGASEGHHPPATPHMPSIQCSHSGGGGLGKCSGLLFILNFLFCIGV